MTELWDQLRTSTQARIGLGRAGNALPTVRQLEFNAAHAEARDAVHSGLDTAALVTALAPLPLQAPIVMSSRARSRAEYLRRPDLGRLPAEMSALTAEDGTPADIGFVIADGLSPRAISEHAVGLLDAMIRALDGHTFARPVIATQARVALADHVGVALGVRTLIVLIGERPGLSVADSVGIYLTHEPRVGRQDAERNCISNVHPPEGLGYSEAARVTASLVAGARALGRSGVDLKDTSRALLP